MTTCSAVHKEAVETDKLIEASIQWAESIMQKVDALAGASK